MRQHLGAIGLKISTKYLAIQFPGNTSTFEEVGDELLYSIHRTGLGNTPGRNGDFSTMFLSVFDDQARHMVGIVCYLSSTTQCLDWVF